MKRFVLMLAMTLVCQVGFAQQRFSDLVGPVGVEPVKAGNTLSVPFLTWGGDVATFVANGNSLKTAKGSTYDKLGLSLNLTKGDDFVQQVRDYLAGKTPFIRGTFDMLGQASEVLSADSKTKPVVILQLTWSAGDHIVAREGIKTLNDLVRADGKKVKIAVQQGGPHPGLIYKVLQAAQVKADKVELVWVQDLTGPKGPAELFRKDQTIDACCVITPDMIGLTGGQESQGTGAEGTVKGAHVVVSTLEMSRAIADVVAVRSDWYKANKEVAEKFVAGYLKGCDELVALRKGFDGTKLSPEYKTVLAFSQSVFGKDVVPTLEIDGHGLLLDAVFVGVNGQVAFFEDKGNLNGFDGCLKSTLDFATEWGYSKTRNGFVPGNLDYNKVAGLTGLKLEAVAKTNRIDAESIELFPDSGELDKQTIVSFEIHFEPNQNEFTADQYGGDFQRVLQSASTFGNTALIVRGHSDPTKTLVDLAQAGMAKGILKRNGEKGKYKYFFEGKELDLSQTANITALIKKGAFDGVNPSPRDTMQAALNLSLSRAEAVKKAVEDYAVKQNINLDKSQIQPVGVGILEPLVAKPKSIEEAKQNMRVEFRIIRVPAEAIKASDFDY